MEFWCIFGGVGSGLSDKLDSDPFLDEGDSVGDRSTSDIVDAGVLVRFKTWLMVNARRYAPKAHLFERYEPTSEKT